MNRTQFKYREAEMEKSSQLGKALYQVLRGLLFNKDFKNLTSNTWGRSFQHSRRDSVRWGEAEEKKLGRG